MTRMLRALLFAPVAAALFTSSAAAQLQITFTKVADSETPFPGTSLSFLAFDNAGIPALEDGTVGFWGYPPANREGVFTAVGGAISEVASDSTLVPGTAETFQFVRQPSLDGGSIAFVGSFPDGDGGSEAGVYVGSGGPLSVVADENDPVPGGTGNFSGFSDPSIDNGEVAFIGTVENVVDIGIYRGSSGTVTAIADTSTAVPGGTGAFTGFDAPVVDGGEIAFFGFSQSDTVGIYLFSNGTLSVAADANNGPPPAGAFDLDGGTLAYEAPIGAGIYLASAGSSSLVPGTDGFVAFGQISLDDGNVAFSSALEGDPGIWVAIDGEVYEIIRQSDTLGGEPIKYFYLGREGLSGNQIVFSVRFDKGLGDIFDPGAIYLATFARPSQVPALRPSLMATVVLVMMISGSVFAARARHSRRGLDESPRHSARQG